MFEKTFHFCPVGLAHVSVDGSFIRVNKRLCDFLGYSDEELYLIIKRQFMSNRLHWALSWSQRSKLDAVGQDFLNNKF